MLFFIGRLISPLLSLSLFFTGSSLLFTVLALVLRERGTSLYWVAGLTSFFYGGYVLSAMYIERFIVRVGIIRAQATFASLTTVTTLLHIFLKSPALWLLLRFLYGVGMAGLCLSIQNWLLNQSDGNGIRGRILAVYMMVMYASQSFGQYLLKYFDMGMLTPFCGAALCTALCIIPVTITRVSAPSFGKHRIFGLGTVFSLSPLGATGALASGIVLGSVYGIVPIVLREWQYSLEQISTVMSLIIIGGMVFQYPVGKLSDGIGRQTVLLMVAVGALSLTLFSLIAHEVHCYRGFVWLSLLWGGTLFTLYPLSMNLACDRVTSDDLLATTGGLMLAYSLGASVGPFMAAFVVKMMGGMGLYLLFSGVLAVVVGWASRCLRVGLPSGSRQKPYANLPLHNGISPAIARAFSRLKGNR